MNFINSFTPRILSLIVALSMQSQAIASSIQVNQCSSVFTSTIAVQAFHRTKPLTKLDKIKDGLIMLGYESEYTFNEIAPILRDFAPPENVIPRSDWKSWSDTKRVEWFKSQFKGKPEFAVNANLTPIHDLPFQFHDVIIDSTGNLELVSSPMLSYAQWESFVNAVVNRYGPGSQQAMVSKPRGMAFGAREKTQLKRDVQEHLGWLNFTNLKDMYVKLSNGYEKYKLNPEKLTAQSFDHAFLGPMTKIKHDKLVSYLEENAAGKMYDKDSVKFVRKNDASFKYTGGPSYRPDIDGTKRFSWEIRNAHKDLADLKMKVRRDLEAHMSGLDPYLVFADIPAFDTIKSFDSLSISNQRMLKSMFPSKADPNFVYVPAEKTALEAFRNFSLPVSELKPLVEVLSDFTGSNKTAQVKKLWNAQNNYIKSLDSIQKLLTSGKLNNEQAKAQIMGALGRFSHDSGITDLFNKASGLLQSENVAAAVGDN